MGFFDKAAEFAQKGLDTLSNLDPGQTQASQQQFYDEGFSVPPLPQADGNGLPHTRIPGSNDATSRRRMMHWFIPEFGIIKMYINPANMVYTFNKAITQERTKGGHVLQYWGEQLTTLRISGTTGSSGVEGINVLYEMYRAEQYAFDGIGLSLAAASSSSGVSEFIEKSLSSIGGVGGDVADIAGSILGVNQATQQLAPQNTPSLAYLAFGVELFWSGWVFRGYFSSFSFTESAQSLGLYEYNMEFVVTQRRGYRTNGFQWQKSANAGPSGDAIPYTYRTLKK